MSFKMCYAFPEIDGRASDRTVHVISFFKQQFRKKGTVLTGYSCY